MAYPEAKRYVAEGRGSARNVRCFFYASDGTPVNGGCKKDNCAFAHPWNTNFNTAKDPKFDAPPQRQPRYRAPSLGDLRRDPPRSSYSDPSANRLEPGEASMSPPYKRPRSPGGPWDGPADKRMRMDESTGNAPTTSDLLHRIAPATTPAPAPALAQTPTQTSAAASRINEPAAPPAAQPRGLLSSPAESPAARAQPLVASQNVSPGVFSQAQISLPSSLHSSPARRGSELVGKPPGVDGVAKDPRLNRGRPDVSRTVSEMTTASTLQLQIDPEAPPYQTSMVDMTPVSSMPTSTAASIIDLRPETGTVRPAARTLDLVVTSLVKRLSNTVDLNCKREEIKQSRRQMKELNEKLGATPTSEAMTEFNNRIAESRGQEGKLVTELYTMNALLSDGLCELAESFFREALQKPPESVPWIAQLRARIEAGLKEEIEKKGEQLCADLKRTAAMSTPKRDEELIKSVADLSNRLNALGEQSKQPPPPDAEVERKLSDIFGTLKVAESAHGKQKKRIDDLDGRLRKREEAVTPRDVELVRQLEDLARKVDQLASSRPPPRDENLQSKVKSLEEQLRAAKEKSEAEKRRHEEAFRTFESRLDTMQREMDKMKEARDHGEAERVAQEAAEKATEVENRMDTLQEEWEMRWEKDVPALLAQHEELQTAVNSFPPAPAVKSIVDSVYDAILPWLMHALRDQSNETGNKFDTLHEDITKKLAQQWSQVQPLLKFVRVLETFVGSGNTSAGGLGNGQGQV